MDELEAVKAKQHSLRERLAARRQERQNLLAKVGSSTRPQLPSTTSLLPTAAASGLLQPTAKFLLNRVPNPVPDTQHVAQDTPEKEVKVAQEAASVVPTAGLATLTSEIVHASKESPKTPTSIQTSAVSETTPSSNSATPPPTHNLRKTSSASILQECEQLQPSETQKRPHGTGSPSEAQQPARKSLKGSTTELKEVNRTILTSSTQPAATARSGRVTTLDNELEDLLAAQTAREKENKRVREEILELLNTPTAKERYLSERFRSQGGSQVQQFCAQGTRIECNKYKTRTGDQEPCTKLHFRKIIHQHTDESLGDCSFLNTCFHVDTCKYVHYTIDYSEPPSATTGDSHGSTAACGTVTAASGQLRGQATSTSTMLDDDNSAMSKNQPPTLLYPPQWINCDIRQLNMSILGKFAVIMADPPWDIHMELPYGTMSDDEMRRLDIPCLQDDGYIFLWVTGRAMELGRECLRLWGYQRVDEIIWVKTNQLQRLIRTGRTGHWLNHGKEHCLVGVKGNPQGVNRGLDCDVIVSEVRETSHKPDEIYGIIERLSPGTRKLELFGRPHNLQPNWITLGNQLDGTFLVDPGVVERFKKHYPNGLESRTKS
ncbi:N6-adenosine-methyltransferase 70 kDa subunit [Clonorchis sinensis]|uniref:mRNA m(6)A methyltransferase n=1 Tax=Clonorchis sinensis TaxID=79923 RepID=G7Y9J7_CLOSI|nr:N6-adenosine-methyltransferase 70 kDa subunit [Clonorchis sinensis]